MTSRKLRRSTVNDLRSFWALYVPRPFENSAIHRSMTCGVFGHHITLPLVPRVNGYRPADIPAPWHPHAAPDASVLSAELPATSAFPPATPGSLATAPDNFFPKPSFFSLTPPKEEGSGYRPYPTHLPTSRGLVPYSDSLPQSSDHFRKLACTSIALPPPSGTLRAPALSCAPVPRRVVPHTQSDLATDKPRTRIA